MWPDSIVVKPPWDRELIGCGVFCAVVFLIVLAIGIYAAMVAFVVGDPDILVASPQQELGSPMHIRVEQVARRALTLKKMKAILACNEVHRVYVNGAPVDQKKKLHKFEQETLVRHAVDAGEMFVGEFTFDLPADVPPSTVGRPKHRIAWELHIKTKIRHWFGYPEKFEILVGIPIPDMSVEPSDSPGTAAALT